jgi:hypothetical protein
MYNTTTTAPIHSYHNIFTQFHLFSSLRVSEFGFGLLQKSLEAGGGGQERRGQAGGDMTAVE